MRPFIISCFIIFFSAMASYARISDGITGNWRDPVTNEWRYGFFEEFAVYKGEFWNYDLVYSNIEEELFIMIKLDETVVALSIMPPDPSGNILEISEDGGDYVKYERINGGLPAYGRKDTSFFREPFTAYGNATVKGYLRDHDKTYTWRDDRPKTLELAAFNFIDNTEHSFYGNIDSLGRFEVKIPVMGAQEVFVKGIPAGRMVVEPGDMIFLYRDEGPAAAGRRAMLFMGDNARLNNEIASYATPAVAIDIYNPETRALSDMEYLEKCRGIYNDRMAALDSFVFSHIYLSEKSRYYLNGTELWRYATDVAAGQVFREGLSREYIDFMGRAFPQDDPYSWVMFSLFRPYFEEYFGLLDDVDVSVTVTEKNIMDMLEEKGELTDELRDRLRTLNNMAARFGKATDPGVRAEMEMEYARLYDEAHSLREVKGAKDDFVNDAIFERRLDLADSVIRLPELKELWYATLFYQYVNDNKRPLYSALRERAEKAITSPVLRKTVFNLNEYYYFLNQASYNFENSIVNADGFGNIVDEEWLYRMLTEPYRGKVIYLDIWGTWSTPSREHMKYSNELREAFKGKEVVFLYLANNSPVSTWEQMIKMYGIAGDNVFHYNLPPLQQEILERMFSVRQYPAYIIIDRDGKIAELSAPAPINREKAVAAVEMLLMDGEIYW